LKTVAARVDEAKYDAPNKPMNQDGAVVPKLSPGLDDQRSATATRKAIELKISLDGLPAKTPKPEIITVIH